MVLTVIAIMLTVIACRTVLSPETTANAQAAFSGVQYTGGNNISFFDSRTGEVWAYNIYSGQLTWKHRLTKLGQPLAVEYQTK